MEIMLVKMTVSTGLYILITVFAWRLWSRHRQSVFAKVAIGVIFGLCSIASTHLGVNYKSMILNVRDIGPLAAGLYFDPVSGIIAGLIGGIERYIAGTYYGVGEFTTKACSLSTCLAGFLSAVLKLTLYKDQVVPANNVAANARLSGAASGTNAGTSSAADAGTAATITKPVYPFMMQSFFIGAVMEVFHMYAVLITHRDHMHMAARVVRVCSLPMIIFSGLGLMICSYLIRRLSGETYERIPFTDYERTPIATRFHRRMLIVLLVLFSINHLMDINFYIHASRQDAESYLRRLATDCQQLYDDMADEPGKAAQLLPYVAMAMNDNALYLLYDKGQNIVSSLYRDDSEPDRLPDDDYAICKDNLKSGVFRCSLHYYGGMDLLCISRQLDNDLFLLIGWRFDAIIEDQINRSYETLLSDILLFTVLYLLITELVNALVVKNLKSVNHSLLKIIEGDLDEKVDVHNSIEFVHLSDDINQTVSTLKGYIDESEHRMEQELKMAATIQEAVLPHVFKYPRDDFEIFALMKPARQVGGDFYDFFFIDADVLALVIADVSGKGIPAAMFMMRAKAAIGNAARTGISTDKILTEVNNFLCEGNASFSKTGTPWFWQPWKTPRCRPMRSGSTKATASLSTQTARRRPSTRTVKLTEPGASSQSLILSGMFPRSRRSTPSITISICLSEALSSLMISPSWASPISVLLRRTSRAQTSATTSMIRECSIVLSSPGITDHSAFRSPRIMQQFQFNTQKAAATAAASFFISGSPP